MGTWYLNSECECEGILHCSYSFWKEKKNQEPYHLLKNNLGSEFKAGNVINGPSISIE
jgi:hypothetical protein